MEIKNLVNDLINGKVIIKRVGEDCNEKATFKDLEHAYNRTSEQGQEKALKLYESGKTAVLEEDCDYFITFRKKAR